MTYRDPEWGMPTKLLGLAALVVILWWNFTSEVFFKPLSMGVIKSENGHWIMVSERLLPWGAVTGETDMLIQVIGRPDGQECQWHTEGLFVPRERDNIVGTQFHPEKSQVVGLRLIANFLTWQP